MTQADFKSGRRSPEVVKSRESSRNAQRQTSKDLAKRARPPRKQPIDIKTKDESEPLNIEIESTMMKKKNLAKSKGKKKGGKDEVIEMMKS